MKNILTILLLALSLSAFAASPVFTSFNTNQFNANSTNNTVAVKSGVLLTNATSVGGNIVTTNLFYSYSTVPSLYAAWDANYLSLTDAAPIATWSDVIGGAVLTCTSVKFSKDQMSGKPAVAFIGGYATNRNFFSSIVNIADTNLTVFVVFRDLDVSNQTANPYMLASGSATVANGFAISPTTSGPPGFLCKFGTNAYFPVGGVQGNREVNILALRYDGTFFDSWLNERPSFIGRLGAGGVLTPQTGGFGFNGDLIVGQDFALDRASANFYVSKILIYTNALNYSTVENISRQLCVEYSRRANSVVLVGDSITIGGNLINGTTLQNVLAFNLTGWNIDVSAVNGQKSVTGYTNITLIAPTRKQEAQYNVMVPLFGVNDDVAAGSAVTVPETNYLNMSAVARSNGWQFVMCTLPSWNHGDTNGFRTNLNNWIYTNWPAFADALCDYAAVPSIGTNGASTNSFFFLTDFVHPNTNGTMLMAATLTKTIRALTSQGVFIGDGLGITNATITYQTNIVNGATNVNNLTKVVQWAIPVSASSPAGTLGNAEIDAQLLLGGSWITVDECGIAGGATSILATNRNTLIVTVAPGVSFRLTNTVSGSGYVAGVDNPAGKTNTFTAFP